MFLQNYRSKTSVTISSSLDAIFHSFCFCSFVKSTTCQKEIELLFVLTSSIFFVLYFSFSCNVIFHFPRAELTFFPEEFFFFLFTALLLLFYSFSSFNLDLHFSIVHFKFKFSIKEEAGDFFFFFSI